MLAQKLILGYSSRIISQVITMLVGIVVARLVGPTILGTVAFGMSFVSIFQFVADLGVGSAHIKLVSEGRNLATCISTFARIKYSLILAFASVVLGVVLVEFFFFPSSFESREHFYVVLIWLCAVTVTQIAMIPLGTFAGLTEQAKQDVPVFLQTIVVQALRVAAVIVGLGAVGLSGAQLAGAVLLAIMYFWMYRSYPRGSFDLNLAKEYAKIALPIVVVSFCSTQMDFLDKVMLQWFSNSEQVGYYTAGYSLGGFLKTIGVTAGILFFPLFSSAVARNDIDFINRTISKFERFTLIFIMPAVILAMIYSGYIVRVLLGTRFVSSTAVLAVMVMGMFFFVLNMPYGNLILGMNRLRLGALLQIVNLGLFILLNAVILRNISPASKALGTAIAVTASTVALGYSFRLTISFLTKEIQVWRHEKFLVAGAVIGSAAAIGGNAIGIYSSVVSAIVFPISFLVLFYGVLLAMKWISVQDLQQIFRVVDIKNVYQYVRTEISDVSEKTKSRLPMK